MDKLDKFGLMRACTTAVRGGTDAEDEHGKGNNGEDQLDMLAIDLADEEGESVFHGICSFFRSGWMKYTISQASKQASKLT
jgi:hypothetical protein